MIVVHPIARALVNRTIRSHVGSRPVAVLEAGGGSRSRLKAAGGIDIASLTVIDIDAEQIRRNTVADEKLLGDLQDFRFERSYDVIEVMNVIEHVEDLQAALGNIVGACSPDGLVVIGAPHLRSLAGIVTRATPHAFHVFFRRHVLGEPNAGKPGHEPFPTFYNPLIAPERLKGFFLDRGFVPALELYYDSGRFARIRRKIGIAYLPVAAVIWLMNLLAPRSYDARNGDFYLVFRKTAGADAALPAGERGVPPIAGVAR
jgi:SAM-dependent methyltransferase